MEIDKRDPRVQHTPVHPVFGYLVYRAAFLTCMAIVCVGVLCVYDVPGGVVKDVLGWAIVAVAPLLYPALNRHFIDTSRLHQYLKNHPEEENK